MKNVRYYFFVHLKLTEIRYKLSLSASYILPNRFLRFIHIYPIFIVTTVEYFNE